MMTKLITLVFGSLPVRTLTNALTTLRYFVVFLSYLKKISGQATTSCCSQLFQTYVVLCYLSVYDTSAENTVQQKQARQRKQLTI